MELWSRIKDKVLRIGQYANISPMKAYVLKDKLSNINTALREHPPLLAILLANRGITDEVKAQTFLNPDYDEHLHDPFLLKGMEVAVARILQAIDRNETVLLFGDYDADGIPGSVVFHDFFKKIGFTNFTNYIPHRHDEGFGLNHEAIEQFKTEGVTLMITIDCGTADVAEVDQAVGHGIDVIITDHHEPNGKMPKALAIINPKQESCAYPFDGLCGSGVVFKLIQAILQRRDFGLKPGLEKWWLDLVGLATLSDMVPLVGENRALAYFGLKVLRKSPRPGLAALLRKMRLDQRHLTEDDIGFMISPRINAASRMGVPKDAFDLLATTDLATAGALAEHLDKINNERKGIVAAMVKDAKKHLRAREISGELSEVIVTGNPKWLPSLAGLAANTLAEEFKRPVFIWGRDGSETIKGSCRTYNGTDLMKLMTGAKKLFLEFGGHRLSGGFSLATENVHNLESALSKGFNKAQVKTDSDEESFWVDSEMSLSDISWSTYDLINQLAPFGVGNPKPQFLFSQVVIAGVRDFGKDKNHLELSFETSDKKIVKAIKFFAGTQDRELKAGQKIDLVASLEKSVWRGFPELRLRIVDTTP